MPANSSQTEIKKLLGPGGPLATSWPGFQVRKAQIDMALEVTRAFKNSELVVIEAGTGTGKTMAYLLPAILSGKKTIISTGLKNLQEQIYQKDLVFIRKHFGGTFKVALLKGRENYLCLKKFLQLTKKTSLLDSASTPKGQAKEALFDWAEQTVSGDLSELPSSIAKFYPPNLLSIPSEYCQNQDCDQFQDCFITKAKRWAQASDLILVNHHLFMADLSVRRRGKGQVLPDWDAAVFDEAHLLEEIATSYFGYHLTSKELSSLAKETIKLMDKEESLAVFEKEFQTLDEAGIALNSYFSAFDGELELFRDSQGQELKNYLALLQESVKTLASAAGKLMSEDEETQILAKKLSMAAETILFLAEAKDKNYVYQVEKSHYANEINLAAIPIKISPFLAEGFIQSGRTLIMTSATLGLKGDFSYFKDKMGLGSEIKTKTLPSPYNYKKQTLLYLPAHLPLPDQPDFDQALTEEIAKLLNLSQGRALVLFTSHRQMEKSSKVLAKKVKWRLLVQEEGQRSWLLSEFKKDINSVLLATYSFWQGVDVPGESLSSVIIDKLPFPRPNRPLIEARKRLIDEAGGNSFMEYFLPEAILTLKQGLGRLMRTETDQGLLAVMDPRLSKKHYGKKILENLPDSPQTADLKEVDLFFKKLD
jgi:ATP-dependent DNA helicase DinG